MKKVFLISILAAFVASNAFAVSLAPVVGYGLTGASTDATGVTISRGSAPAFGVASLFQLDTDFFLEADVIFAGNKFSEAFTSSGMAVNLDIALSGLVVPVLGRYMFTPGFSVGAGPVFMMGMGNVTSKMTVAGTAQPEESESYELAGINKTGFGAALSLGATIPTSGMYLVGDIRYTMGLSNAFAAPSTNSLKLNALHFMFGVAFGL